LNTILATQPAPTVDLHVDACLAAVDDVNEATLHDAVALAALDDPVPPGARVHVMCAPEGLVLHRELPSPAIVRVLDLAPIDPAIRERVLALAIVELTLQRAPDPMRVEPSPEPPPVALDTPPSATRASTFQLYVGGHARWFVPSTWLAGGQLGLRHHARPHFGWSATLDFAGARTTTRLGSISVFSAAAMLGVFGYQDITPRLRLAAGGGFVVGWSHWWGTARPDVATAPLAGPWLGPWGDVRLDVAVAPRWSLSIRTELGYAIVGVRALANDASAAALAGVWVGASIGLGWTIPAI